MYIDGIHRFRSIDQDNSSMTEDLEIGEEGIKYRQQVQFTVRQEYDRELAKKYERRPLVVHVWAVNGCHYKLGTKSYPAYLVPSKTNSKQTVETAMTVEYETKTAIMWAYKFFHIFDVFKGEVPALSRVGASFLVTA